MMNPTAAETAEEIEQSWQSDRWAGVRRVYTPADVFALRGSIRIRHTLAEVTAEKLWKLLRTEPYIETLGAMTGNQAVQMVRAGLKAIYLSGWQVAADANLAGQTYPDMSLYPSNSAPALIRRLNQALLRADQIEHMGADSAADWLCPIVADGEAGFGGPLNVFELMKSMIEAGAAGAHFEDQLASDKKCGHMGGKVLVPTSHFIRTLNAARLAADVMGTETIIVARTDAKDASLITNDIDPRDRQFLLGERTPEGLYRTQSGLEVAIARGLAYSPYADLLWFETQKPDLEEAELFAKEIHKVYPEKLMAYNLSPSFNWDKALSPRQQAEFQQALGQMGYRFQFITLAGFHSLNHGMFDLAKGYAEKGLPAYVELQRREFESEPKGYAATRHQSFVGASYFDEVLRVVSGGLASTTAMENSAEEKQFVPSREKVSAPSRKPD